VGRELRRRRGHRKPGDDQDYQVPFTFTGTLNKLTPDDRPAAVTPDDIKTLTQEGQRNNRASE